MFIHFSSFFIGFYEGRFRILQCCLQEQGEAMEAEKIYCHVCSLLAPSDLLDPLDPLDLITSRENCKLLPSALPETQ